MQIKKSQFRSLEGKVQSATVQLSEAKATSLISTFRPLVGSGGVSTSGSEAQPQRSGCIKCLNMKNDLPYKMSFEDTRYKHIITFPSL